MQKKYKTNTIVKYIIYNNNGHFVYFKDLEMKGVMSIMTIQEELQHETNYLSLWIHIKA